MGLHQPNPAHSPTLLTPPLKQKRRRHAEYSLKLVQLEHWTLNSEPLSLLDSHHFSAAHYPMWAALRARASVSPRWRSSPQWKLGFSSSSSAVNGVRKCPLDLQEIEKVLTDVKADDVKVIPAPKHCDWADFMVLATGRSTWHVKNIAQALIYKAKQKQKGAERMMLPSVEGQAGGKWIVIDSGKVIVHALDEKARAYYNLEGLWTGPDTLPKEPIEDLQKALVKIRRKNNSKKPAQRNA